MDDSFHKASVHFYEWECRNRGYYAFPYRTPLEMPYIKFLPYQEEIRDDGLVPRWWERLFLKEQKQAEPVTHEFKIPKALLKKEDREVIVLSYSGTSESTVAVWEQLIILFSTFRSSLSFEIMARLEHITISMTCHKNEYSKLVSHIHSYLPSIIIGKGEQYPLFFEGKGGDIGIADLGLEFEYMLPLAYGNHFHSDPLLPLIAVMENLDHDSSAIFQVIFERVKSPLGRDTLLAVSDGRGGCFFREDEAMLEHAKEKVSAPLFSCVLRIAGQGRSKRASKRITDDLISACSMISDSELNRLVPLSNLGYPYSDHANNIFDRRTNRPGMVLNAKELATFIHYPERSVVSHKLGQQGPASKRAPSHALGNRYHFGINTHHNESLALSLSDEQRLSHMHVIGVTGTGKSTLLANLFLEDARAGNGCVIIDPHGDIVDDILVRIPKKRKNDVILIDPSDMEFPVGFNLLHAETEVEKIVLSSDLVATFRRYATSWGDRMTSVLANAIDTFLDSTQGGTLLDLKRFLLEKSFRENFLKRVSDPYLREYWRRDFEKVTHASLTPLLLRLDTFLRPKIVRSMMAQKDGIDFAECIAKKKIVLVKLSRGLIGEENAHLLGSLIVSKLGQVAQGRQVLSKEQRHPYYVYLDEFHHLITPSIADMVSGLRKYGVGLVLAHQDLVQLGDDKRLLHSVIGNPHVRVCFRLSQDEAKVLEQGFSGFTREDLTALGRGETIVRVGGSSSDCNMTTAPLSATTDDTLVVYVRERTRKRYAKRREEDIPNVPVVTEIEEEDELPFPDPEPVVPTRSIEEQGQALKEEYRKQTQEREHEYLKTLLSNLAQDHGFRTVVEEGTESGGRVDIGIHGDAIKIACEISSTNTKEYEVKNIKKGFEAGYDVVFVVSKSDTHREHIEELARKELSPPHIEKVFYFHPDQFLEFLLRYVKKPSRTETVIKGYRVRVNHEDISESEQKDAEEQIAKALRESLKKKR